MLSPILDRSSVEGRELIAPQSTLLSVPASCTFEPLHPPTLERPPRNSDLFSRHQLLTVPCDHQCAAAEKQASSGMCDTVHRFTLQSVIAARINPQLIEWALHKEVRAKATSVQEDDGGVQRSNWGGFQSHDDIFEDPENAYTLCIRELHVVASAALDELQLSRESDSSGTQQLLPGAHAWVNLNRGSDRNFMHVHEAGLVSAVYFVSDGDPALVAVSSPPQGQLIFRGGPQPPQWKAERADSATHTYLAIPPTPGTLVCFPGSVPHCVFPLSPDLPLSRKFEVQPRISFAMNFRVQAPQPERLPVPPETVSPREPSRIHHGIPQGATTLL